MALVACAPAWAQTPASRAATEADVRFVRDMIPHHQQALDMTALVQARTEHRALRMLAERIETTQRDEIAWMQAWLAANDPHAGHDAHAGHHGAHGHGTHGASHDTHAGHDVHASHHRHDAHGTPHGTDHGDHAMMPGMLTPNEMARLAAASGALFEALFLEGMIRHHEGAVGMVGELFASPGAAHGSDLYRFASDVEADQAAEIARMRVLLADVFPLFPQPRSDR